MKGFKQIKLQDYEKVFYILILIMSSTIEAQTSASWYGSVFHGNKTASGKKFDKNEFTAAHKSFPFGTILKVTNISNNKSVIVTITDRGPFPIKKDFGTHIRVLDLSEGAFKKLAPLSVGVIKIKFEVITDKKETSFNINKEVFDIQYGFGKITNIDNNTIEVAFTNKIVLYTLDGRETSNDIITLSLTEYNICDLEYLNS